jgi:hypothetical protein
MRVQVDRPPRLEPSEQDRAVIDPGGEILLFKSVQAAASGTARSTSIVRRFAMVQAS